MAEDQEGYGRYQVNIKDGQRFSAADAFLKPVLHRPNLDSYEQIQWLKRLLVSDKKAVGVKAKVKNKRSLILLGVPLK